MSLALLLPVSTLLGAAIGLAHFAALEATVEALARTEGRARPILLTLLRFALTGGLLAGSAHFGALPLLAAATGLALGRGVILRRARRRP